MTRKFTLLLAVLAALAIPTAATAYHVDPSPTHGPQIGTAIQGDGSSVSVLDLKIVPGATCGSGDQCLGGSKLNDPSTAGQNCNNYWWGWYVYFQYHTWFCTNNGGFHWILIS